MLRREQQRSFEGRNACVRVEAGYSELRRRRPVQDPAADDLTRGRGRASEHPLRRGVDRDADFVGLNPTGRQHATHDNH